MRKFLIMIRILLVCTFLTDMLTAALPAQAASLPGGLTDPVELEAFLDGVITTQMTEHHVPGVVVVVVKDGAIILEKGYGYADLETRTPVDPEQTLFRPGSISKLFVWTAVMQLVKQGRLDLDADVNTYLDFTIPATFPEPITLRHLMTHTPGFEDRYQGLSVLRPENMIPLGEYLKTNMPARVFPPGKLLAYSNYGASLAGYIVERVSGLSFDAYVEQNIFAPLGMEHSSFRQPLPENLAVDMAGSYNFLNGAYQKGDFELMLDYPDGSLSATASDMARFMITHLQNGRYGDQRILQEDTAIRMREPLFEHDPRLGGMAYGFFEDTINGQHVLSHGGALFCAHSDLFLLPDQNVGVFVSTNSASGWNVRYAVRDSFFAHYYPVQDNPDPQPPADFGERIAPYLGEYSVARSSFTTVEKTFNLLSPAVSLSLTEDGYLSTGDGQLFVEVEPGLLQLRDDPNSRLAYRTGADGQRYLFASGSTSAFFKTPWYGSVTLHQILWATILVFFLIALIRWSYGFLKNLRKQEPQLLLSRLAHWNAGIFGLLFIVQIACFAALMLDNAPVYEVPRFFFVDASTRLLSFTLFLPWLLAFSGFAMPAFTWLAWSKKIWNAGGRIFYTLLTLCALTGIWLLIYWNFWL